MQCAPIDVFHYSIWFMVPRETLTVHRDSQCRSRKKKKNRWKIKRSDDEKNNVHFSPSTSAGCQSEKSALHIQGILWVYMHRTERTQANKSAASALTYFPVILFIFSLSCFFFLLALLLVMLSEQPFCIVREARENSYYWSKFACRENNWILVLQPQTTYTAHSLTLGCLLKLG